MTPAGAIRGGLRGHGGRRVRVPPAPMPADASRLSEGSTSIGGLTPPRPSSRESTIWPSVMYPVKSGMGG